MTLFVDAVAALFTADGPLAASTPGGLQPRQAQIQMARAVAEALETQTWLAVEAGTGVGKTFAYLAPLLLSGRRALLSTATQSLQEQLFARDIPALSRALGLPVRVVQEERHLFLNTPVIRFTLNSSVFPFWEMKFQI